MDLRQEILETAIKATVGDRNKSYGHPSGSMQIMADLINAYFKTQFTMADMAIIMVCNKLSRIPNNKLHIDNNVDGAAYLAIQAELQQMLDGINNGKS